MNFTPKDPDSKEYFGFRYAKELANFPGVTIASAAWSVTQVGAENDEVDANPSAMKSGNAVIGAEKVSQLLIGGVERVQYCFQCEATFSDGQIIAKSATCWVQKSCRTS
jgi:hypothetical protein